jgi:type I restriction enzyme S subunit
VELREGYKQTTVGIIPKDWDVITINDIADVTSGKRLPKGGVLTAKETQFPYIRVTDMIEGSVIQKDIMYIPEDVFPAIRNYRIFKDDIFISVAGTLGIVGKVPLQLDGANLTENANRITNISINRDYLMYLLISPLIQNTIESEKTLGAQPKLALERIRNFKIPIPPTTAEQVSISNVLTNTYNWIQSLTSLMDKKQNIKQGTMQTLLYPYEDGKLKLGWRRMQLEDICSIRKGELITQKNVEQGNIPVIAGGKKPAYFHNKSNRTGGVITVSASGASAGYVSKHEYPIFASDCSTIEINDDNINFIYYLLKNRQNDIYYMQTGGAQPHIHPKDLRSIKIIVPLDNSERNRIANILSDMDEEISVLKIKLTKANQIKQGMMQNLLTGKIRLV